MLDSFSALLGNAFHDNARLQDEEFLIGETSTSGVGVFGMLGKVRRA